MKAERDHMERYGNVQSVNKDMSPLKLCKSFPAMNKNSLIEYQNSQSFILPWQ